VGVAIMDDSRIQMSPMSEMVLEISKELGALWPCLTAFFACGHNIPNERYGKNARNCKMKRIDCKMGAC
jgi:hypothetical protein